VVVCVCVGGERWDGVDSREDSSGDIGQLFSFRECSSMGSGAQRTERPKLPEFCLRSILLSRYTTCKVF
jgi:hypothetical protein